VICVITMVWCRCCSVLCPSRAAPQVNRIASEGLDWAGMSDVPFVTMITGVAIALAPAASHPPARRHACAADFAHSFDHPWIQSRRQHVICGSSTLQEQARDQLFPSHSILATSGMPIGHKFYDAFITHLDKRKELLQQARVRLAGCLLLLTVCRGLIPLSRLCSCSTGGWAHREC
jgi:hypothetical protein